MSCALALGASERELARHVELLAHRSAWPAQARVREAVDVLRGDLRQGVLDDRGRVLPDAAPSGCRRCTRRSSSGRTKIAETNPRGEEAARARHGVHRAEPPPPMCRLATFRQCLGRRAIIARRRARTPACAYQASIPGAALEGEPHPFVSIHQGVHQALADAQALEARMDDDGRDVRVQRPVGQRSGRPHQAVAVPGRGELRRADDPLSKPRIVRPPVPARPSAAGRPSSARRGGDRASPRRARRSRRRGRAGGRAPTGGRTRGTASRRTTLASVQASPCSSVTSRAVVRGATRRQPIAGPRAARATRPGSAQPGASSAVELLHVPRTGARPRGGAPRRPCARRSRRPPAGVRARPRTDRRPRGGPAGRRAASRVAGTAAAPRPRRAVGGPTGRSR